VVPPATCASPRSTVAWNDVLWPLIAVTELEMFPLPVALALLRGTGASESHGPIMAGAPLTALPLLIVFPRREPPDRGRRPRQRAPGPTCYHPVRW
jgi:ABC-type glycerol-3-phosphate transport system permease component